MAWVENMTPQQKHGKKPEESVKFPLKHRVFGVFCWLIVVVSGRVGSDWLMNAWCLMVDKWLRILMFESDDEEDVGNH